MAELSRRISLPGSERPRVHSSKLISPVEKDKNISVTFVIRPRPDSPPLPDLAYWQTTPLKNRRYLSTQEYAETYGAAQSDLDIVTAFVETHGMTVLDSHAGKRSITVQGTAAQMNAAFGIELNSYESPLPPQSRRNTAGDSQSASTTHSHHGFDGAVSLPSELSGIVTAVVGLDNSIRGGHSTPSGDPPGAGILSVPQIASYYNFPNPTGGVSDRTIGIFAGQIFPEVGATYMPQDLSQYFSSPALSGYSKTPNIYDVNLTVGSVGPFKNKPTSYPDIEITQDISIAATVAQGVNINVYFTEQTEQGWLVFLNRILLPPVGETQPTVVTSSWFITASDSPTATSPSEFSGPFGSVTDSGSIPSVMTSLFQALAAMGISVFISGGDSGADAAQDGSISVQYPGSDPWVTCCGGTILSLQPPAEWVWSDWSSTPSVQFGASCGGPSANFPTPVYQTEAGITAITDASTPPHTYTGKRFTPDIAGMVGVGDIILNGSANKGGGTSAVSPLYAGLYAVVQSAFGMSLGFLNPTLYKLKKFGISPFNDITHGNNDSDDGAPFFEAGPGWDACTGWGSIDGIKFVNSIAELIFPRRLHFVVDKHTFSLDEVEHVSSYLTAFRLVLDGFTPNAVGTLKPTIHGSFATLPGVNITVGTPTPEFPSKQFTPQRISYSCSVKFNPAAIQTLPHGGVFPVLGDPPLRRHLGSKIHLLGDTVTAHETAFNLVTGPDPFFKHHGDTGKVTGLIYDRFGDFEGFLLWTEEGKEKLFRNREKNFESLLRFIWEKGAVISVLEESHTPHSLTSIILRELPHEQI